MQHTQEAWGSIPITNPLGCVSASETESLPPREVGSGGDFLSRQLLLLNESAENLCTSMVFRAFWILKL